MHHRRRLQCCPAKILLIYLPVAVRPVPDLIPFFYHTLSFNLSFKSPYPIDVFAILLVRSIVCTPITLSVSQTPARLCLIFFIPESEVQE